MRNRLTGRWSGFVAIALVVGLAGSIGALGLRTGGRPAKAMHQTVLARWVQRHGSTLTRIVQGSLVFEATPSEAACARVLDVVEAATGVPAPPGEQRQWETVLRDLAGGASVCEKGMLTVDGTFGIGGRALGEIVDSLAKRHIRLGVRLENDSMAVLRGMAATTAPPSTASPMSGTAA